MINDRSFLQAIPLSILYSLVVLSLFACTPNDPDYKDRVVLRVNEATLSAEEFSNALASRLKMFNSLSAKDSAVIAHAKSSVVQDFIVSVVTSEWAQKNQIFVRKEAVDAEINKILKGYPDQLSFRKALADEGLSYSKWEDRLRYTLLERLVVEKLREKIQPPTEEQIKNYYSANKELFQVPAAVKLRQLVSDNEERAKMLKKELSSGRQLSELAKKFSISTDASVGGDIGWVEKGAADFFDKVSKLGTGQKSNIIKTSQGYHIFEVLDRRNAKALSLEDVRTKIKTALLAEAEQATYSTWLESQIVQSRVYKDDDFINQIQVQTRSIR